MTEGLCLIRRSARSVSGRYRTVKKTNTRCRSCERPYWGTKDGIPIAPFITKNAYFYALTKNLTHEPASGGVQSSSGQHPVISATVPDGHAGDCDFVQDSRFQLPRPAGL